MKRSPTIAIRCLAALACGIASAISCPPPPLTAARILLPSTGTCARRWEAQRIPGLALGIAHRDRIVHMQGFGQVEKSGPEVTPQTPLLIGSVTKSFTALAIMQLSEAGRVQLDAPVQRYLPWCPFPRSHRNRAKRVADPDASTQITVRHLLYQVSGLSKATGNAYATSSDTGDSTLEHRVRALHRQTHPTSGHDVAVQQRQLLDARHDRAGSRRLIAGHGRACDAYPPGAYFAGPLGGRIRCHAGGHLGGLDQRGVERGRSLRVGLRKPL